ncbi:PP2C family protein-serine/threonine phosphatase [Motiliproteus sediminis]|uniref:PP2C family protein-serine/threonine phosphatase n=1 Tax=Motiliproteus sediminis TaxID=1468178 RepID=UPI001AEF9EDE|nr:SpoIIE family protein phosphatase [Motiliproteus sediminis]
MTEHCSGARIMVIEDEAAVRFNLVSYLEDCGFRVAEYDDGDTALAAVAVSPPDLVLTDLWMPGLNGQAVVSALQQRFPDLPVIVVSGTGVLSDAVEALRRGAWDFVAKPIVDMAVLEHAITAALEKAGLRRQNRRYQAQLEQANAELSDYLQQLELDADAGRQMQQQLMPAPRSQLGAYSFERCLLPSLHLSGDFVDYFVIDPRYCGFYLADVSGHGVSSALVTVLLHSYLHRLRDAYRLERDDTLLEPTRVLGSLNHYLRQQGLDKYLTIFYGVIDGDSGELRGCNGGQLPEPVFADVEGDAAFLAGSNLPVGLMDEVSYEPVSLCFNRGSLLLCSDGVLELLPEATLSAKRQRLLAVAASAPQSVEQVLQQLEIEPGERYPDDVTLLLIRNEGGPTATRSPT